MEINFIEWALISRSVSEALEELAECSRTNEEHDGWSVLCLIAKLPYKIRHPYAK